MQSWVGSLFTDLIALKNNLGIIISAFDSSESQREELAAII
jgi:hypothetical protein